MFYLRHWVLGLLLMAMLVPAVAQERSTIVSCPVPRAALLDLLDPQKKLHSPQLDFLRSVKGEEYKPNLLVRIRSSPEVNKSLQEEGFEETAKGAWVATATMKIKFPWEGAEDVITVEGKSIPAIRFNSLSKEQATLLDYEGRDMVVFSAIDISVFPREKVYIVLCSLKDGDKAIGPWKLMWTEKQPVKVDAEFNLVLPMLSYKERVNMPEFLGIIHNGVPVDEAYQETKIALDETGGSVESAAVAIGRGGPREKAERTITFGADGKPFLYVIMKGNSDPALAAFMGQDSWKRPPRKP